jgi:hypothetical protein
VEPADEQGLRILEMLEAWKKGKNHSFYNSPDNYFLNDDD